MMATPPLSQIKMIWGALRIGSVLNNACSLYFLANWLGNMSNPTNEPINTESIQEGLAQQHRRVLWDSTTAPFRMGTPISLSGCLQP